MSTLHPERGNPSDQWEVANLIVRQEPDEEEDEEEEDEEEDGKDDDDDEGADDGYSERAGDQ